MRIKLTPDADRALGLILDQLFKQNPFIEKDNSRLMSALIVTLQRHLQPRHTDELVQALVTPEAARLALVREVEGISAGMNTEALRGLEATLRKYRAHSTSSSQPIKKVEELEQK